MGQINIGRVRMTYQGVWDALTAYVAHDTVSYQGSSYAAASDPPVGTLPTDVTYWTLLAEKGDTGATGATGPEGPVGPEGPEGPAGADATVTTAAVQTAGALMDSEVTNLAQVKAFNSSDYATAAQGATADSAQQPPIEGPFVDGDKTKLDAIDQGVATTDSPTHASLNLVNRGQIPTTNGGERTIIYTDMELGTNDIEYKLLAYRSADKGATAWHDTAIRHEYNIDNSGTVQMWHHADFGTNNDKSFRWGEGVGHNIEWMRVDTDAFTLMHDNDTALTFQRGGTGGLITIGQTADQARLLVQDDGVTIAKFRAPDTTTVDAQRILTPEHVGWGGEAITVPNGDCDDCIMSGVYRIQTTDVNSPGPSNFAGILQHTRWSSTSYMQIAHGSFSATQENRVYKRIGDGTTWGAWEVVGGWDYTSAPTTLSTNTGDNVFTHGLGAAPTRIELELECTTAESGFAVGDRIMAGGSSLLAASNRGIVAYVKNGNTTQIHVNVLGNLRTVSPTGTEVTITFANWDVIVKASA